MATLEEARARLLSHFSGTPEALQGERWAKLWDDGTFLPWDRGCPNPALEDTMKDRRDLFGSPWLDKERSRRKRALVPGCGRGYDVLLLASFGYDAYGLEISKSAVEGCEEYVRDHAKDHPSRDSGTGAGSVNFLLGDFFKDDWLNEIGGASSFELIYDYTVFDKNLPCQSLPRTLVLECQL